MVLLPKRPSKLVASQTELVPHAVFVCDHFLREGYLRKVSVTQENQMRQQELLAFSFYLGFLHNDQAIVNDFLLTHDEKNAIFMVQKQNIYVVNFEQYQTIQRIFLEHPCNDIKIGADEHHLRILYSNMFEEINWVTGKLTTHIKMEEDFFTFLNLRHTHFIVWNLNSIQVFELKRRFCKIKVPFDQPTFLALDQDQKNLFIHKDKRVQKWSLWSISREQEKRKAKHQELGLLDFTH
mmetsp:Transcript_20332/g.19295  ORF Transcript_20332/g.19295 Transcript_20332/m.19295 type:complete len:237 (+) Transcript_20332:168-878(+)